MGDSHPDHPDNTFIFILGRLLAAAAAVIACFLLYRFAKGFWVHYKRGGRRRSTDRRHFFGRKDVLYSRLGSLNDPFVDEDEGYHDSDSLPSPATPKSWTDRPLPDKPLPPLPEADAS